MKEGDPVQGDGVTAGSNNGDTTPNKSRRSYYGCELIYIC